MLRRLPTVVVLALALGAAAGPAAAAPKLTPLAPEPRAKALTDGTGVAAWQWAPGEPVRVLFDSDPDAAAPRVVASPEGCTLGAVGAGRLAFACYGEGGGMTPVLHDLATGTTSTPPGADRVREDSLTNTGNGETYDVDGLGTTLLRVAIFGNHVDTRAYLNWRTGEYRTSLRQTRRTVETLARSDGRQRLCAPLRRRPRPRIHEIWSFEPLYFRPFLLRVAGQSAILHHCGRSGGTVLSRRAYWEPVLTSRYVAWVAGLTTLRVRMLPSGRTMSWRLPPAARSHGVGRLVGTARRVFVVAGQTYVVDLGGG